MSDDTRGDTNDPSDAPDETELHDSAADLPPLSPEDEAFVAGLLAALPPVHMPPEVAARIEAALAAEAARRTGPQEQTEPAAPPAAAATVVPLDDLRAARAGRRTRVLQVAAGVVLVAAGVLGVAKLVGGGSSGGAATASDTGGAVPADASMVTRSGHGYTDATLVSDVRTLVDHGTLPPDATATPSAAFGGTGETPKSPTDTPSTVETERSATQTPSPGGSQGSGTAGSPSAPLFTSTAALASCLAAVEEGLTEPLTPVALDQGVYKGQVALVVVLPGSADPTATWDVFVVGAACGQAGDAHLLVYQLVPRT